MFIEKANISVDTVAEALWYISRYYGSSGTPSPSNSSPLQKARSTRPAILQSPDAASDRCLEVEDTSRVAFFALIIGIDKYKYNKPDVLDNLNGAVADADDMEKYLLDNLHVPQSQIINLRDENATRNNIKTTIAALTSDQRIRQGDAILIFYAGHGAQARAPVEWQAGGPDNKVEMIVPHDFNPESNVDYFAQGIPDVTIAALLTALAKVKGDNITLIFDSCQSGSIDRGVSSNLDRIARGITLPSDYAILSSIDSEERSAGGSRTAGPAEGYAIAGMASHVLLAACSSETKSYETGWPRRGEFTSAVLALLRNPAVRADMITYEDVILGIGDLKHQAPQCFGKNKSRILFNNKTPESRRRLLYRVTRVKDDVVLEAGEIQGVTKDATFDVFSTTDLSVMPVCRLIAKIPSAYSTVVEVMSVNPDGARPELPSPAWALQTRLGVGADISIAVPTDDKMLEVFRVVVEKMKDHSDGKRNIQLVDFADPHELALQIAPDGRAAFNITDTDSVNAGLSRIPYTVPFDGNRVYDVFSGAADFFYHLRHSNIDGRKPFAGRVTLNAYSLESVEFKNPETATYDPYDRPIARADGLPENLNVKGVMRVSAVPYNQLKYGFEIKNGTEQGLYAWVFLFNMSNLSIDTLYEPSTTKPRASVEQITDVNHKPVDPHLLSDISIPKGGTLTIGYGAGGGQPLSFSLGEGLDVDVSYIKVYIMTQYVSDFPSRIAQDTPFVKDSDVKPRMGTGVKRADQQERWGTELMTIVQERRLT